MVRALAADGTNLYVGPSPFLTEIAKWDGSTWLSMGVTGQVIALAVSGTNLYAGGLFTAAGGMPATNIAKWDGHAWSALGPGMNSLVRALAVDGTNLYAGGYFTNAGGVSANYIAKWDGHTWSALGSGMGGLNPSVWSLAVIGTNLYAGGSFTLAGGMPATNIAKWNGSAWSPLGSGVNGSVLALAADGSRHLFVGGAFSMAGTNAAARIAQANLMGGPPTILTVPQTQTAEAGSFIQLAADATGYPPPTYQWFFNDYAVTGCTTNCTLCLSSVQVTNSGAYALVVSNRHGVTTSDPVMLNVIPRVERRAVPALDLLGETGSALNVEYADALGSPTNWLPLDTVSLTSPPQYFFDLTEPLPPQRFYRVWQTGTPATPPSLNLPFLVPAITLTGNIGDQLRLDCINQFGPTDAWVNLDTVTLTNTSQLYFDLSAPGQPRRLYRIVPVP